MIIPQPETDLSLNPIVTGADVIRILKDVDSYVIVEDLLKAFVERDDRRTLTLFLDTLTYLYALGVIEEKNYKVRLNHVA